eukprot:2122026-Pyramimonas_sp.AAC.1
MNWRWYPAPPPWQRSEAAKGDPCLSVPWPCLVGRRAAPLVWTLWASSSAFHYSQSAYSRTSEQH